MKNLVNVSDATKILLNQELVAIPTDTVYGLAAIISSENALKKIFSLKKRPLFDPLIVHVSSIEEARKLSVSWGPICESVAERFWPGPITIVTKKNSALVSDLVTSGLSEVAIRIPDNPLCLQLLQLTGIPLAAPSANLFSKTSPTTIAHVRKNFPELPILDGGPSKVGIESTVIRVEEANEDYQGRISILRKGMITASTLEQVRAEFTDNLEIATSVASDKASPGQMDVHYQMECPLIIIENAELSAQSIGRLLSDSGFPENYLELSFTEDDPVLAARELYSRMHELSESAIGRSVIFRKANRYKEEQWAAIFDRLYRAASKIL